MKNANFLMQIVSFIFLFIIVIGYFTYKWIANEVQEERKKAPFSVSVLETGKSDCIVIETGGKVILVDSGYDKNAEEIIRYLKKNKIDEIDYMILTHPDKDHIGGADKIINAMNVKKLIHSTYNPNTKQYKQYMKASVEKKIELYALSEPMKFSIGDASFTLYPPEKQHYEKDNDYSLVLSAVYKETTFLFAGDAEEVRLKELMNIEPIQHLFLKIPHHGKYNKQTKTFLERVNPEYSVITCSDEEQPKKNTLAILKSLNSKIFLTSEGTVYCTSDGKNLKVTQGL